jgi:hypothetical protein
MRQIDSVYLAGTKLDRQAMLKEFTKAATN